jgi:hypothetical protein
MQILGSLIRFKAKHAPYTIILTNGRDACKIMQKPTLQWKTRTGTKRRRKNYIPMAADREVSGLNGKMEKHETSLIPLLNSRDWK